MQKSVTIALSLERSQKEDEIDQDHPYVYISWLCGDDQSTYSEINGLKKKKMIKESNISKT